MTLPTLLSCVALLGALVMLAQHRPIALPAVAAVVSGFEVLSAFGVVHLSFARVPLPLLLGIALAIVGVAVWLRTAAKSVVSAATAVALVGALQVFAYLR